MLRFKCALIIFVSMLSHAQAAPKVVVSIVPLHSLVAGVMDSVGTPELLLKGINSEHQGSYSPQQISDLGHADLVFTIGDNLEVKLGEMSGSDAVNGHEFVKVNLLPGIITHKIRKGGNWEVDNDEPAAAGNADPHIWLDPENAKVISTAIAEALVQVDGEHAQTYRANATKQNIALDQLEKAIATELSPVKDKPFIVFHDAYQYFERRFGLKTVGSISDYAATPPSAQRLEEVHSKVKSTNAACVFKEPQFSEAAANAVTEGSLIKLGELDPVGAKLIPSREAYFELLRNLAANLRLCLSP
jgi:zinc transport system substrate-binding protein